MPSNINATVPATSGALQSAPVRNNFATAKAEIEALQAVDAGLEANKVSNSALPELVQDIMGASLIAGANTTVTYNDTAGTITIASSATNLTTSLSPTNVIINSDTGTDATIPATDGTNAGVFLPTEKTKLSGIATSATANSTDAQLRDRATHTGTQTSSTISDFNSVIGTATQTALDAKVNFLAVSTLPATGTSQTIYALPGGTWHFWNGEDYTSIGGGSTPSVTLNALTLATSTFATDIAEGSVISAINGKTAGSTITTSDARFTVSGSNLLRGLGAVTAGSSTVSLVETLSGATNSPRTSTPAITITAQSSGINFVPALNPLPTTEYYSHNITKIGTAQSRPTQMLSGNGTYWIDFVEAPSVAHPNRIIGYFSSDHDDTLNGSTGSGGIYAMACVGDPTVTTNWRDYNSAVAEGWFDDIPSKPASNPIYLGAVATGNQVETPCINKVGNTFVMTYQASGGMVGAINQATLRATSTDGINFTGTNTALMQVSTTEAIGDGHQGYFKWGPNPFPTHNYNYIGYSLVGGQTRSTLGMWGWDDPVNGTPVFISAVNKVGGRVSPSLLSVVSNHFTFAHMNIDVKGIKETRQGYATLATGRVLGSGATATPSEIYEVLFDSTGLGMLSKPKSMIDRSLTPDAGSTETPVTLPLSDKYLIGYIGANSSNEKVVRLASSPLNNPENTYHVLATPALPPSPDIVTYNLTGGSLPAGLELVTVGSPTVTYNAQGMSITVNGATQEEVYIYQTLGHQLDAQYYYEIYVNGLLTTSTDAYRVPYIGISDAKVARANMNDALFLSNGESTAGTLALSVLNAGTKAIADTVNEYYYGVGYGASGTLTGTGKSKKNLGFRIFPQAGRGYVLGEGGVEMNSMISSNGNFASILDKTNVYYPFVAIRGISTNQSTERIETITVKRKSYIQSGSFATVGGVAQAQSSANAQSYSFSSVNLGTASNDRVIVAYLCGRSTSESTNVTLTLTPDGGSPITMTRHVLNNLFTTSAYSWVSMFTANVPAGTTGSFAVSVTGGGNTRCGLSVANIAGVLATPSDISVSNVERTQPQLSTPLHRYAGGIVTLGAMHSTSGSLTNHTIVAEQTRFATGYEDLITLPINAGQNLDFVGIDKTTLATSTIEATGSASYSAIAASFAPI